MAGPLLEALDAAKQLHRVWVHNSESTRQRLQLLKQPPPAVCSGEVLVAVCSSTQLLDRVLTGLKAAAAVAAAQHSQTPATQMLLVVVDHHVLETAADLTAWLQQRPVLLAQPPSSSSSSSSCGSVHLDLWLSCTQCMVAVADLCWQCNNSTRATYATELYTLQVRGRCSCSLQAKPC
jgi:hypothetical protein